MKRWNGWGREDYHYELPPTALITWSALWEGLHSPDAALEEVVGQVPASRCPP